MTKVPIMPLNCEEFFADPRVQLMPGEAKAMWLQLLAAMWLNKAWISTDDQIIARALDLDVRRWRSRYKPILSPLLQRHFEPIIGDIYRQSHLTEVWDNVANRITKNREKMANARAALHAQQGKPPPIVEPKVAPTIEPIIEAITEPITAQHQNLDKKGGSTADQGAGASRPVPVSSLRPTPALLRSKLVTETPNGFAEPEAPDRAGAPADPEPLRQPQRAEPADAPAVGLFAALERAIRKEGRED